MNDSLNSEFTVHEWVVHPAHGPGLITGVEQMDAAVSGFSRYYVIDIYEQNLTVRVPVRSAERIGLRSLMSSERLQHVLEALNNEPTVLPDDYKQRQALIRQRIKTTRPVQLAEVIRDLFWHGEKNHLTSVDSELLHSAMERLSWEIACAAESSPGDGMALINRALSATDNGSNGLAA